MGEAIENGNSELLCGPRKPGDLLDRVFTPRDRLSSAARGFMNFKELCGTVGITGRGHISIPYRFTAHIITQVVKMKAAVKPGIAYPFPTPANQSPMTWEKTIHATAVTAAPKTERKKVALFDFVNGPDQNAIPVRTELNPNRPNVTSRMKPREAKQPRHQ